MRVVNNLNISLESIDNLLKFKEGNIIKGKILEIKENSILLALPNGANITAIAENTERFEKNQMLILNVISAEDNELPKLEILDPNDAILNEKVNELGLKDEVDIASYKKLMSLNINSNENFEVVTKNFKYLSTLFKNLSPLLGDDISKEDFINIINKEFELTNFNEFEKADLKKLVIKSFDLSNKNDLMVEEKTSQKTEKSVIEHKESKVNTNLIKKENIIKENVIKTVLGNEFIKENSLDSDKLIDVFGKLIKFGKKLNIENLNTFNKLSTDNLLKEYTIIKEEILKLDDFEGKTEVLNLLKGINIKDFKKEDIKEFINKIYFLDTQIENKTDNLKSAFDTINKSINFMEKTNDELAFFQLPIEYQNDTYNMDIYVKNKNNKSSDRNKKILISLNTNYLDNVSVVIDYSKDLDLRFKVENKNVKDIFDLNMDRLKRSINGYKNINIVVDMRNKSEDIVDNFIKDENIHYINVRI